MHSNIYEVTTRIWLYTGHSGWHFVSIPPKETEEISSRYGHLKRGWGSLRVEVTIGKTVWTTSIFPDKKEGIYLLPIKKEVREKESISADQKITFTIQVIEN